MREMARVSVFFALVAVALAAGLVAGDSTLSPKRHDPPLRHSTTAALNTDSQGFLKGPSSNSGRSVPQNGDSASGGHPPNEHDEQVEDDIRVIRIIIIVIIVILVVVVILVLILVGLMFQMNRSAARWARQSGN
ncbi:uncharacterized protein LOC127008446 [Eriocheir sinensis]|uniref:uncharacterized protein LOC127008446 n=1 Tax=Eriocheir sinensis TaxID=95602 RepID=UPI0021C6B94B|nr:uncharacterized protein LOC127008446 [Eriocheir sinensis]